MGALDDLKKKTGVLGGGDTIGAKKSLVAHWESQQAAAQPTQIMQSLQTPTSATPLRGFMDSTNAPKSPNFGDKLNVQSRLSPPTQARRLPLIDALSNGAARGNTQTELKPTPNILERIGSGLSGAYNTYKGQFQNTYSVGTRALNSNINSKVNQDMLMDFYNRRISELESELEKPKMLSLRRKSLEQELENYKNLAAGRDPAHEIALKTIASGESDIARAKQDTGFLGGLGVDVGVGAAQLAGDIGIAALTGGSAMVPMAIRSFGGGAYKAEQAGASLGKQAAYGGLSAATSVLVERLTNVGPIMSKFFGKGFGDDAVKNVINNAVGKVVKNPQVAAYLSTIGASAAGEGLEEAIESLIDPLLEKLTYNPDAKYTKETATDAIYDGLVGAIIGGIAGGVNVQNAQKKATSQDAMLPNLPQSPTAQDVAQKPPSIAPALQDIAPQPAQQPTSAQSGLEVKLPTAQQSAVDGVVEPVTESKPAAQPKEQTGPHIDDRSYSDVSSRKVKAFQYDNPELHQHYVNAANGLLSDLGHAQKGERWAIKDADGYFTGFSGSKRSVTSNIENLLDHAKLKYAQIEKGLHDLIADQGQENYAAAKKIELVLDDMLTNGYEVEGYQIEPDYEYIRKKEAIKNGEQANDYAMTEDEWSALLKSEPATSPAQPSIFPENSLGAKLTQQQTMPDGTGAMTNPFVPAQETSKQKIDNIDKVMPEKTRQPIEKNVIPEKESLRQASQRLSVDLDGEKADLASKAAWSGEDLDTAMMIKSKMGVEALETGDFTEYQKWRNEVVGKHKSEAGRALQSIQKWTRDGKQSALELVDSVIDIANKASNLTEQQTNKILNSTSKYALSAETQFAAGDKAGLIDTLSKVATERGYAPSKRLLKSLNKLSNDAVYDAVWKSVQGLAFDQMPRSFGSKLSTYQYISHLLNAKTLERNTIANVIFAPIEQAVNNLAVIPDGIASAATATLHRTSVGKMRTVGFERGYLSKASRAGVVDAARNAYVDIALDINRESGGGKYMGTTNRTFKRKPGSILNIGNKLEGALGYGLNWTDAIQKGATQGVQDVVNQRLVDKGGRVTPELAARFTEDAVLTRSFQRQTLFGQIASTATNWMNVIGVGTDSGKTVGVGNVQFKVKDIGLGDLVQKYTQVMGALATSGAEYTPLGYAKAMYNLGVMTQMNFNTMKGRGDKSSNRTGKHKGLSYSESAAMAQHDFALSLSRAMTGTGLAAICGALAKLGILYLSDDDDYDKENMKSSVSKLRGLMLNLSALGRMIDGKDARRQDGDYHMDIDFTEPVNSIMRYGITVSESEDKDFTTQVEKSIESVTGSIIDMPFMQNIRSISNTVKYRDKGDEDNKGDSAWKVFSDATADLIGGSASGFIPGPVRHLAQSMDNTVRDTSRTDSSWKRAGNRIIAGVPWARETLPTKSDTFGREQKYTESNLLNALNAHVIPGAVNRYKVDPVVDELLRLDTGYPARKGPKSIKDKATGTDARLNADERTDYQKLAGSKTYELMGKLVENSKYKQMDDERKAEIVSEMLGYAKDTAKRDFIGSEYKSSKFQKVYEAEKQGIDPIQYFLYKDALSTIRPEGGTPSQLQMSRAIIGLDLTTEQKGKLWDMQSNNPSDKNPFTGELAQLGLAPTQSIEIMDAFKQIESDLDGYVKQNPGESKAHVQAAYFLDWLSKQGYNAEEIRLISDVYKVWQMIPVENPSKKAVAYIGRNPR